MISLLASYIEEINENSDFHFSVIDRLKTSASWNKYLISSLSLRTCSSSSLNFFLSSSSSCACLDIFIDDRDS
jgi:hypothetical protein